MNSLQLIKFPSGTECLVNGSEWIEKRQFGVVFLNAGIVNMVGPNRIYTKLAERLKHEGFPSFRFDFSGVGNGIQESNEFTFEDYQINETTFVLEEIKQQFGIKQFILLGLCSGGDVAFRMARSEHPMLLGTILINAFLLPREEIKLVHDDAKNRLEKRLHQQNIFSLKKWVGLFRKGPKHLIHILKKFTDSSSIISHPSHTTSSRDDSTLVGMDSHPMLLVYSEGSVSYEVFKKKFSKQYKKMVAHGANNLNLMYFAHTDHNFATVISQLKLFDAVVNWLKEIKLVSHSSSEKPAIENLYH
ncbi:MAG: alpha/beta fold hydrolase [Cytophagales bacterium]|nr:alpha/beta fold hydrolase [Cytophagales bacterium]